MRLHCPLCGDRDVREFYTMGSAQMADRPTADAGSQVWSDYLHLRDNPAGPSRELWHHEGGCGAWLVVTRNTANHEVLSVELAEEAQA